MRANPSPSSEESYEAPALLAEDVILFPETEVTITMQDPKNVAAAMRALKENSLAVLIPARFPEESIGTIGTLALLRNVLPTSGGSQTLSKGLWRVRVEKIIEERPYVRVRFTKAGGDDGDVAAGPSNKVRVVQGQIDEFTRMMPGIPREIISFLKSISAPGRLADICAQSPLFTHDERLDLLRTIDPEERLSKVNKLFDKQLGELRKLAARTTIPECTTCIDLADRTFELGPGRSEDVAREFLEHVVRDHPEELLSLLAERYGPVFLNRRALK